MNYAFISARMSKDRTKVGCVIVGESKNILSTGFNGFPSGVLENEIRCLPEYKYLFTCHAEQNALDLAESPVKGAFLFTTHHPCANCARSIIQKRIKTVFYWHKMENERWKLSMNAAKMMLKEAKIPLICLNTTEFLSVEEEILTKKSLSSIISTTSPVNLPIQQPLLMDMPPGQIKLLEPGR